MRRFLLANCVFGLAFLAMPAAAQPRPRPTPDAGVREPVEEPVDEEDEEEGDEPAQLRPPTLEAPDLSGAGAGAEEEEEAEEEAAEAAEPTSEPGDEPLLTPEEDEGRLARGGAETQSDPTTPDGWAAPQAVLTLHGYFRGRGELQDTFSLGRPWSNGEGGAMTPFDNWIPVERRTPVAPVAGGCSSSECDTDALANANMRLRLQPQLNLSDDVRIKMWIDVFDNMILGSTPDAIIGGDGSRSPFSSYGSFGSTALPSSSSASGLTDSIVARRAWAEVRNRTLGELRFGRMGWHWGLGMVANAGDNFDGDYSTDVDRLMAVTKLAGLYLMAAYDFSNSGVIGRFRTNTDGSVSDYALPYDPAQRDDATQYMFSVARRSTAEEQAAALSRGDVVLNAGAFLLYRYQLLSSDRRVGDTAERTASTALDPYLVRRRAQQWVPDVWAQLLVGKLRIEFEGAAVLGSLGNTNNGEDTGEFGAYNGANVNIAQWGATLDAEYRLLDDKLAFHFNTGFASGDSEAANDGLGALVDSTARAPGRDGAISTFRFHPNYRVDLILWRSIMRQISGAYYFRPGVSYDFIRGEFGQLLGGRVDLVYSRASSPVQTWGNSADLGVEIDASIYYRSEDGPELLDGFYAMAQFGLLFPMQGLGYLSSPTITEILGGNPELKNAQMLRLILGVQF